MARPVSKKFTAVVLTALAALALSGCMKQQSAMTISKKERVTGDFSLLLHNEVFELMRAYEEDPALAALSPAEYRRKLVSEPAQGGSDDIRVPRGSKVEPVLGKTYSGVKIVLRDASFAAVNRMGSDLAQTDETPGKEKPQFRLVKNAKKQVVFTYRVTEMETDALGYRGPKPTYKVSVTMPGKVLAHNGKRSKRTVTWKGTPSQKKVKVLTATSRRR